MALSTMYKAKPNSPQTTLAADISAADTSMTVADATVLPTAPNLCTIGDDENAEVVSYTTITGNVVSGLIRGASGTTASVWTAGTVVARDFTSYDHDTFVDNINDLNTALSAKANNAIVANAFSTSAAYDIGDLVIYQGNLYKFTSAHSAGAWNASHVSAVIVADGFMKKTGDTMTGAFGIKNPNMSRSAPSQSEIVTSELWFLDANDDYLAWNQCGQETTGKIFFSFGAGRYKQNTTTFVSTNVGLFVDKDGTKQVKFTGGNDKDIWLDALGLSDSGWKSYTNSTKFSGTIYYRKIGNVLYFSSGGSIYLVSNCTEYENLGTIPSGYRPSKDVVLNCYINTEVAVRPLGLRINASGIIYIYANSGETITPQHPIYLSGCGI